MGKQKRDSTGAKGACPSFNGPKIMPSSALLMKTGGDYDVRINRKRNKQSEDPMRLPGWRKSWTKCSIVPHAGARIYSLIRDNENSLGIRMPASLAASRIVAGLIRRSLII
jgi:hypothetical protein